MLEKIIINHLYNLFYDCLIIVSHQIQHWLHIYRLGAESEPVLQSVLGEADPIEDKEAGGVGLFRTWGQRFKALVWDNAQTPTHRVVAHLRQLFRVYRFHI